MLETLRFVILAMTIAASSVVAAPAAAAPDRIGFGSLRPAGWDLYLLRAGEPPRRITNDPALDYGSAWSPDGRYVVFTSERRGTPDLFVLDLQTGSAPRLLVSGYSMEDQATFSPDGRTIYFVSTREGNADIYSVPFAPQKETAVSEATRLTSHVAADLRPSCSPDGQRLVFTSTRDSANRMHPLIPFAVQTEGDLYTLDLSTGAISRLTDAAGWDGSASYSPDGQRIYFYSERLLANEPRLFVMAADGSAQEELGVAHKAISPAPLSNARVMYLTWSDEAERRTPSIRVFSREDTRDEPIEIPGIHCYEPAPQPNGLAIVCHGPGTAAFDEGPSSPGPGPLIAPGFPRQVSLPDREVQLYAIRSAVDAPLSPVANEFPVTKGMTEVHLVSITDESQRLLLPRSADELDETGQPARQVASFAWSPDGSSIIFSLKYFRNESGTPELHFGEIWRMDADGSSPENLTADWAATTEAPGHSRTPVFSNDGRSIFFAHSTRDAQDIMRMDLESGQVTNLTRSSSRESFPTVSADGRYLAFLSDRDADVPEGARDLRFDLYVARLHEAGLWDVRRLTNAGWPVGHPRFSPDGKWIIYTSGVGGWPDEPAVLSAATAFIPQPYGEIWAHRLSDGLKVRLTHNKWEDGAPSWAPGLPE